MEAHGLSSSHSGPTCDALTQRTARAMAASLPPSLSIWPSLTSGLGRFDSPSPSPSIHVRATMAPASVAVSLHFRFLPGPRPFRGRARWPRAIRASASSDTSGVAGGERRVGALERRVGDLRALVASVPPAVASVNAAPLLFFSGYLWTFSRNWLVSARAANWRRVHFFLYTNAKHSCLPNDCAWTDKRQIDVDASLNGWSIGFCWLIYYTMLCWNDREIMARCKMDLKYETWNTITCGSTYPVSLPIFLQRTLSTSGIHWNMQSLLFCNHPHAIPGF